MNKRLVSILSLIGVGCFSLAAIAQDAMLQGASLVSALRQGDHVLLIRHAAGDKNQKDAPKVDLADCKTQRNLSREGRIAARSIGQAIDSLQLPIGEVLSSPYCRAMDTGRLAFGNPKASGDLGYFPDNDEGKRKAASVLNSLLSKAPAAKTNTVLVSHSLNIMAAIGFVPQEGEAVIIKPGKNGKYEIVGRVQADQWDSLVSK